MILLVTLLSFFTGCSKEKYPIDKDNTLESKVMTSNVNYEVDENGTKSKVVDYVITDAMPIDIDIESMPIIKGDAKSITIAAASVIAKVTRDRMMIELDSKYPEYGFKKHKGYPTKAHIEAINKYGLIDGYRKTYGPVKELIEKENKYE